MMEQPKARKTIRYKKLEEKKPTIIFSCNPVNYNLLIEYTEAWNTSRSLMVDALIDYAITEYKQSVNLSNSKILKHIDQIINAKRYAELEKDQHL